MWPTNWDGEKNYEICNVRTYTPAVISQWAPQLAVWMKYMGKEFTTFDTFVYAGYKYEWIRIMQFSPNNSFTSVSFFFNNMKFLRGESLHWEAFMSTNNNLTWLYFAVHTLYGQSFPINISKPNSFSQTWAS